MTTSRENTNEVSTVPLRTLQTGRLFLPQRSLRVHTLRSPRSFQRSLRLQSLRPPQSWRVLTSPLRAQRLQGQVTLEYFLIFAAITIAVMLGFGPYSQGILNAIQGLMNGAARTIAR